MANLSTQLGLEVLRAFKMDQCQDMIQGTGADFSTSPCSSYECPRRSISGAYSQSRVLIYVGLFVPVQTSLRKQIHRLHEAIKLNQESLISWGYLRKLICILQLGQSTIDLLMLLAHFNQREPSLLLQVQTNLDFVSLLDPSQRHE